MTIFHSDVQLPEGTICPRNQFSIQSKFVQIIDHQGVNFWTWSPIPIFRAACKKTTGRRSGAKSTPFGVGAGCTIAAHSRSRIGGLDRSKTAESFWSVGACHVWNCPWKVPLVMRNLWINVGVDWKLVITQRRGPVKAKWLKILIASPLAIRGSKGIIQVLQCV